LVTGEYADPAEAVLDRSVEDHLSPGDGGFGHDRRHLHAGSAGFIRGELNSGSAHLHGTEKEAVPEQALIETLGALFERSEGHAAGGEADARADRREVVQVVVQTLHLKQDRAGASGRETALEAKYGFGRLGVGDRVGDRAGATRPLCVSDRLLQGDALGGPLQAPMLVEEPEV